MKVSEVMTRDVAIAAPDDTIQTAARIMADSGVGALPVAANDRLVGIITDRDIVVRAVAQGKSPTECEVREVMTGEVNHVFDDDDVSEVAKKMAQRQVRRMPVLNRDKRLVGIVSIGDLALSAGAEPAGEAQPTGQHEPEAEPAYAGRKPQS